jgi:hypothetical protein
LSIPSPEFQVETILNMLGQLVGMVLCVMIMSVGFMMILGVAPAKTIAFWKRHVFRPLWRLVTWPFRWLANEIWKQTKRGAKAGANATGRGAWWVVRQAAILVGRGLAWAWRELDYRARRAYHGRNYHRP